MSAADADMVGVTPRHLHGCRRACLPSVWARLLRRPWRPPMLVEHHHMLNGDRAIYWTCAVCGLTSAIRITPKGQVVPLTGTDVFGLPDRAEVIL